MAGFDTSGEADRLMDEYKQSPRESISVLIRTFNSGKTLEKVILGLGRTAGDEVVIVDSGSIDNTLAIARKYQARIIQATAPFNYSKSLNLGFAASRNPWVLVLSSHAIPMVPAFLEAHRAALRKFPANVAVGYAPSSISKKNLAEAGPEEVQFYSPITYLSVADRCGNANTIYRRSIWEKLPFDETIRTAEDKLWLKGYIQLGGHIAYIPGARTLNCNQGSLAYMFRKGYSDARSRSTKAGESPGHQPMSLHHLGGALKNLFVLKVTGETTFGNWLRCSAHSVGAFFGSRQHQDNTLDYGTGK